jgi:two-component system repressor protein LuxO
MHDTQGPVLLVEDTPSLAMLYESVLKRAGYDVDVAFTGQSAEARFAQLGHGVVLLDLMLPDADGLDILRDHGQRVDQPCGAGDAGGRV